MPLQNGLFGQPESGYWMTIITVVLSPSSRGTIGINSSNPLDYPIINPNVLAIDFDKTVMREAIRSAQTYLQAPAFEGYIIEPSDKLGNRTSDEELDEYIQLLASTALHPSGTAAMSAEDADYGVVNPDLLVKKTSGLRIVDASVFVSWNFQQASLQVYTHANISCSRLYRQDIQWHQCTHWRSELRT
jgi:choline dehydrogenase-like flavoprotein